MSLSLCIAFYNIISTSCLLGKVWLIVMVFLRILTLLFAGYPLYQDEQERFVCNTIQPGCSNVCYDLYAPVSLFRFWLVQLVTLCLPYLIFIVYVVHKVSSSLTVDLLDTADPIKAGPLYKIHQESFRKTAVSKTALQAERGRTQRFTGAYILHLLFRILLEAGFGATHYYLFGFYIPRRFLCQQSPCTTQVDCYISRPTEKTVMLNFMLGAGALSLFLNTLDLICAIKRSVRQKRKRKMLVEKMYEEEQFYLSAAVAGGSRGIDSNVPLAHQDLEPCHAGSFRKRGASKGSSGGGGALGLGPGSTCLEHSSLPHPPSVSLSTVPPGSNTNGNNRYSAAQEEALEAEGSEVALFPLEPMGTPRSIRVSKRSRLKPPPPPRRDLAVVPPGDTSVGPIGDVSTVCSRRVGQYTLVEVTSSAELQTHSEGHDKRSEWV